MATNYGYEKGKYGIFAGTIITFPRKLDGADPNDATWVQRVPSGYLRCDGSIKNGDDFPALKNILGVGESSKYKKSGVTLQEAEEDGSGGQFQLPDLGSKYIRATAVSGGYAHLEATNPVTSSQVPRVGVAVALEINAPNPVSINYTGSMSVPSVSIPIGETLNFGTTLAGTTPSGFPDYTSYLPHGHYTNVVVRDAEPADRECSRSDSSPTLSLTDVDVIDSGTTLSGTFEAVTHAHTLTRSSVSRSTNQNNIATTINPDNITTTINLNQSNTSKMDDIQHSFILVEYLIKI